MRDLAALGGFIASREAMPFEWGKARNDCAAYFNAAGIAQTGRDILSGISWATLRGARRVMKAHGGIEALADKRMRRIALSRAMRGDVAGVPDRDFGVTLMIVEGETLVGPGDDGNVRLPRSAMIAAWSID